MGSIHSNIQCKRAITAIRDQSIKYNSQKIWRRKPIKFEQMNLSKELKLSLNDYHHHESRRAQQTRKCKLIRDKLQNQRLEAYGVYYQQKGADFVNL